MPLPAAEPVHLRAAGVSVVLVSDGRRMPAVLHWGADLGDLAAASGRDKTRLIPILDRLEARGLLRRTPDPADRRNRIVALTAAGRELVASCRAGIREVEAELLAGLDPDERTTFVAVLDRLADAVRDR